MTSLTTKLEKTESERSQLHEALEVAERSLTKLTEESGTRLVNMQRKLEQAAKESAAKLTQLVPPPPPLHTCGCAPPLLHTPYRSWTDQAAPSGAWQRRE